MPKTVQDLLAEYMDELLKVHQRQQLRACVIDQGLAINTVERALLRRSGMAENMYRDNSHEILYLLLSLHSNQSYFGTFYPIIEVPLLQNLPCKIN